MPGAQTLVDAGIRAQAAVRLARAGFTSLEKIAAVTRDDLLAVYGVSLRTVEQCERALGHDLPWPTAFWREKGFAPDFARILCKGGIDSLEALGKRSFKELRALGLGPLRIRQCEAVLGRLLDEG
ncbi:MAG: helix-hairpin-helix domain-containing protein [Acidobacteriota bacterium]